MSPRYWGRGFFLGASAVKAAILCFAMVAGICICGIGIYSADASTNHFAVDGYGVSAR